MRKYRPVIKCNCDTAICGCRECSFEAAVCADCLNFRNDVLNVQYFTIVVMTCTMCSVVDDFRNDVYYLFSS